MKSSLQTVGILFGLALSLLGCAPTEKNQLSDRIEKYEEQKAQDLADAEALLAGMTKEGVLRPDSLKAPQKLERDYHAPPPGAVSDSMETDSLPKDSVTEQIPPPVSLPVQPPVQTQAPRPSPSSQTPQSPIVNPPVTPPALPVDTPDPVTEDTTSEQGDRPSVDSSAAPVVPPPSPAPLDSPKVEPTPTDSSG